MSDNITVSVRDKDVLNINMQSESTLNMEVTDGVPRLVNDYDLLINRPSIETKILEGNQTFEDLGLVPLTNRDIEELLD